MCPPKEREQDQRRKLGQERGGRTLLLAAVGGTGRKTGVALAADHLVAVRGLGEETERRLDDTTTEAVDRPTSQRSLHGSDQFL